MDKLVEEKWQAIWEKDGIFNSNPEPGKKKVFVTFPFPYMNGPLHIGHGFTITRLDVYARFKRMQGFNTLFPWAWHWTGQPIVAAAERLSSGDPAMLKEFIEIDRIPKGEISKFYDPEYMAKYYTDSARNALKRAGISIDWRREFHTTDLEPLFNKFVLWQMNTLKKKGYITQGTHPVVWCPRDQSPTGDHDRLEGVGVTWEEFTLVLFPFPENSKFGQAKLPAATLRPETIFGVTNLWVNPDAKYVELIVNDKDRWIVSERAVSKLGDQLKKLVRVRTIEGSELIGERILNPLKSEQSILILPAGFVDPNNGSGIVYSVPAHAPMDFVALRDLQNKWSVLEKFNLSKDEIGRIKPISLISIPDMGQYPAVEIVEKLGIKDQMDPRVSEATKEIYKKEFHRGVLNANAGEFESKRVSDVKPLIVKDLNRRGLADILYELPEKVVCRCTTECTVKILEDQWFLRYSDPEWKKKAHECIDGIFIFPSSTRQWFHDVIDWIRDWPCARRVGLGTPLPWSPGWIVETLSDSTVYTAFYTIIQKLREHSIQAENLTDAFFDHVLLGEGDIGEISSLTSIPRKSIEEMRSEFLYWYPVDLRNSGKELIPNHLTFYVLQHVAFFPKSQWPAGISTNGMMMNEGVKMSKSKGNVITLSQALDQYGADILRAALVSGAEGLDDIDWMEKNVRDVQIRVAGLPNFISSLVDNSTDSADYREPELLLESQIQKRVSNTIQHLEVMRTKSAFQEAFYDFWNDLRYYLGRTDAPSRKLLEYCVNLWIRLLSPFLPFTCEEINSRSGGVDLLSKSLYPIPDPLKVHLDVELAEVILRRLILDCQSIMKLIPTKVTSIHIYLAPEWSYRLFVQAINAREEGKKSKDILEAFFNSRPDLPKKEVADMLPRIVRTINELGEEFVKYFAKIEAKFREKEIYFGATKYMKRELNAEIVIHEYDEQSKFDPKQKAKFAIPLKPALYLE